MATSSTSSSLMKGSWRRMRQLGSGAFGVVHVWRHEATGETIALKQCRFNVELTDKQRQQWRQEVSILEQLRHPHVISCRPPPSELMGNVPIDLPLLCMEYCNGGDLRAVLNTPHNACGLPQTQILAILSDITSALGFLHNRRIIHRDLKPENVVLHTPEENKEIEIVSRPVYKLIDLGYAKKLENSSLALSFVGTLQYLAPELFTSSEYSRTVDYWSLGLLAHEIVCGRRPFLPDKQSPGDWIHVVERKHRDVIAIDEDQEKNLISHKEITTQNFLSATVKQEMESWLRLLLDFDPHQRGKGVSGDVEVFSMLHSMLARLRLRVVLTYRVEHRLDFVVQPGTKGIELLQHLKSNEDESLLVLLSCPRLQTIESHTDLFGLVSSIANEDERVVYVYNLRPIQVDAQIRKLTLVMPERVQRCLKSYKTELDTKERRQTLSQVDFFLRQELTLLADLCASLNTLRTYVASIRDTALHGNSLGVDRIEAMIELFQLSLSIDLDKYCDQSMNRDHVVSEQMFMSWQASFEDVEQLKSNLVTDSEECKHRLLRRVSSASSIVVPGGDGDQLSLFESFAAKSEEMLTSAMMKKRNRAEEKVSIAPAAVLVVKALKTRDEKLQSYFSKLNPLVDELVSLLNFQSLQKRLSDQAKKVEEAIKNHQNKRQADIWKLMAAAVEHQQPHT